MNLIELLEELRKQGFQVFVAVRDNRVELDFVWPEDAYLYLCCKSHEQALNDVLEHLSTREPYISSLREAVRVNS